MSAVPLIATELVTFTMLVARATSSPILSSMRRSTPGIGEAFQSRLAACTTARLLKSAFRCIKARCVRR